MWIEAAVAIGSQLMKMSGQAGIEDAKMRQAWRQAESLSNQAVEAQIQGNLALLEAKKSVNQLTYNYNKQQSMNAVATAGAGRSFSGGSIQALMNGDKARLAFDTKYLEESGQLKKNSFNRRAEELRKASLNTLSGNAEASNIRRNTNMINNAQAIGGIASDIYKQIS